MSGQDGEEALLRQVKAELRTRMRALRKALPAEARAARSARIWARALARPEWISARTVLLFASMPTEVDTSAAEAAGRAAGKTLALPRIGESGLEIRAWDEGTELVRTGSLRVPEPAASAASVPPDAVDLVIVPALALDPRGARIGYGGGYYDRLLPLLPRARRVAVAFDFQLLVEIPQSASDARVHAIVTDERELDASPG